VSAKKRKRKKKEHQGQHSMQNVKEGIWKEITARSKTLNSFVYLC
jgi:hypothetical protein